jgi:acylphosphatase
MKIAKKFIVKGYVQGVGFRYFTVNIANRIGVYGYVQNMMNGNVEVYAIGDEEQLKDMKSKLEKGPSYGRVDEVIEEPAFLDNSFCSFSVEY